MALKLGDLIILVLIQKNASNWGSICIMEQNRSKKWIMDDTNRKNEDETGLYYSDK